MKKIEKWKLNIKTKLRYLQIRYNVAKINSNIIFFFPHYNTGGAERVHLDIMHSVSEQNITCFITEQSKDSDLLQEFEKYSKLIELYKWGWQEKYKKRIVKIIAKKINQIPNVTIFGCNSRFFYDLLPFLHKDVNVIDLVHTFLGEYTNSMDNYSLKHIEEINTRIVLGENQRQKQIKFYIDNQINIDYTNRIKVIPNKTTLPNKIFQKNFSDEVIVLFVARNSEEKRSELFIEITKECYKLQLPIKFIMIGDFEEKNNQVEKNVTITGKITNVFVLNTYYEKAHMIAITSIFEGFPMVLLEAMARGAVPISTAVGEIPTYISENKDTGILIENSQDELKIKNDFVEKLVFINNNRELLKKYSLNVQNLVKLAFNEKTFTEKYRNLIIGQK